MTEPAAAGRFDPERIVVSLRNLREFDVPGPDDDPPVVHEALAGKDGIRERLDLFEPLLLSLKRELAKAELRARRLKDVADDAYDKAMLPLVEASVRNDFESVRDREVAARVSALPQRGRARQAERYAALLRAYHAEAVALHWGLLHIREELLGRLTRYLPWVASMEYSGGSP